MGTWLLSHGRQQWICRVGEPYSLETIDVFDGTRRKVLTTGWNLPSGRVSTSWQPLDAGFGTLVVTGQFPDINESAARAATIYEHLYAVRETGVA